MNSYLARIEALPPEIIADFRIRKKSAAVPAELQDYLLHLDAVMEIRDNVKHDNITRLAKQLKKRYPELSERVCKERVYDAYNLFHVHDSVSNDVWDNIYADKMENLAQLCIAKGKEELAFKAFIRAHEYRTKSEDRIKPEDLKGPTFIISQNIKPEDVGFESKALLEISKKATAGHYARMIDNLPIEKEEKDRLRNDAGITDAEIIEDE